MISNKNVVRVYNGFFKMDKVTFDQTRFDGSVMKNVVREVFVRNPVVFLSLYDAKNDKFLMVEQVRIGAITHDDKQPLVLEPIAGIIESKDKLDNDMLSAALQTAIREADEEAGIGVDIESIKIVQQGYTSPGGSSEYAYFAVGNFDSSNYKEQIGGVEGENEDVRTRLISMKEAKEMVQSGEVNSLSGAFGIFWHMANN